MRLSKIRRVEKRSRRLSEERTTWKLKKYLNNLLCAETEKVALSSPAFSDLPRSSSLSPLC